MRTIIQRAAPCVLLVLCFSMGSGCVSQHAFHMTSRPTVPKGITPPMKFYLTTAPWAMKEVKETALERYPQLLTSDSNAVPAVARITYRSNHRNFDHNCLNVFSIYTVGILPVTGMGWERYYTITVTVGDKGPHKLLRMETAYVNCKQDDYMAGFYSPFAYIPPDKNASLRATGFNGDPEDHIKKREQMINEAIADGIASILLSADFDAVREFLTQDNSFVP
ncbi:MAG: hypothetical protein KJ626_15520 [Verrucomicrobia bacterium]|nr:hypothetical protein [Verrucomicrobiota bacterium]